MSKEKHENLEENENTELKNEIKTEEKTETPNNNASENQNEVNEKAVENGNDENVSKMAEMERKLAEEKDRFLRLYSEFDNYKKRTMRERTDLLKSAGEDVFKLILPVLDDFERAMKANDSIEEIAPLKEGFGLIYHKLKGNLKGLEEVNCMGETFDSERMEAIANIPAPSEDMKSKVVDVLEKGYMLNGKVIRFAKVVVGN